MNNIMSVMFLSIEIQTDQLGTAFQISITKQPYICDRVLMIVICYLTGVTLSSYFSPGLVWVIVIIVRVFPVAGNKSIVPISLPDHCHSPPACRATINIQDTTSYHTQQHTWLFGNLHMYHTQSIVLEFGAILVWWWYNVRFRQCLVLPCCISTKNFPINLIQFAGKLLFSKIISEFVN